MKRNGPARHAGGLLGNPAWEAVEAARGNYDHDDAVQLSFCLLKRFRSQWGGRMAAFCVDPYRVIAS
jgi:hypothetical protein